MKFIFLDIDGVLNCTTTTERHKGMIGIEDEKLQLLKEIVSATGAKIILTSTWKTDWFPDVPEEDLPSDGKYLNKKFAKYGLHIMAKTEDECWGKRGEGILRFMGNLARPVTSYVILDDERFDYIELGMDKNLVKTQFVPMYEGQECGLHKYHVEKAINILNGVRE